MPTVAELTEPYGNFMLGPVRGPRVCDVCLTFTDGYPRCYTCARTPRALDVLAPISYSVAAGQLHHVLAAYKRQNGRVGRLLSTQLAAVLWRFLGPRSLSCAGGRRCVLRPCRNRAIRRRRARRNPSAAPNRERNGRPDARSPPSAARQVRDLGCTARVRPAQIQRDRPRAGSRCAGHRRHLDHRFQRSERRNGPERGRRADGRGGRDRAPSESRMGAQRAAVERARSAFRLDEMRILRPGFGRSGGITRRGCRVRASVQFITR